MWKLFYESEMNYLSNLFRPNIAYIIAVFMIIPFLIKTGIENGLIIPKLIFPVMQILPVVIVFFIIFRILFYYIGWKKFKVLASKENKENSIAFYFHMQQEYISDGIIKKILCFSVGLFILDLCFSYMPTLTNKPANNILVLAIPVLLIYTVFACLETIKPFVSEITSLIKLIIKKPEQINLTGVAMFLYQGVVANSEIYKKEKEKLEKLFDEVQKSIIKEEKMFLEQKVINNLPKKCNRRL